MNWSVLGFNGLRELINIHPVIVHFPVALFPASFLLYALGVIFKRRSWCVAGRACLYLAALGAAAAVWSGLEAEEHLAHNARIHELLEAHETIGIWIGWLGGILAVWSFAHVDQRPRIAPAFLILLGLTTLAVAQNSDLGGRMVFVEGAGVKAALPLMEGGHHHHDADETPDARHHAEDVERHEH